MCFAPGWFTTISCNNNKYLLHIRLLMVKSPLTSQSWYCTAMLMCDLSNFSIQSIHSQTINQSTFRTFCCYLIDRFRNVVVQLRLSNHSGTINIQPRNLGTAQLTCHWSNNKMWFAKARATDWHPKLNLSTCCFPDHESTTKSSN
jgi:hypothetical protein